MGSGYSYKASCARPISAVICNFDIRALWRSDMNVRVPRCQKLQWLLNPVCAHRMLYSCSHMATVGVKGLKVFVSPEIHLYTEGETKSRWTWYKRELLGQYIGLANQSCIGQWSHILHKIQDSTITMRVVCEFTTQDANAYGYCMESL